MHDTNHEAPPVAAKLRAWLAQAVEAGASDLHLIAGYPPVLRLHGDLTELAEPPLRADEVEGLLRALCTPEAFARLKANKNLDLSFEMAVNRRPGRFRANLLLSGGGTGACL